MTTVERLRVTRPTSPVELLVSQLRALELWHDSLHAAEAAAVEPGLSREARLDAGRHLDVRRREQRAIFERMAPGADEGLYPLPATVPARAVVAHRHVWTRDKLSAELVDRGVQLLCAVDNGAEAVGVCVAEQPDLLVLDDLLVMRNGCEVSQEVARLCPHTIVAGYVSGDEAVGPLLDAGADAVFTRQVPPALACDELVRLVRERSDAVAAG